MPCFFINAFKFAEHVFQLRGQLTKHLAHFLSLVILGQGGQRLEQNGETVQLVPESEYDADLLDVVTSGIPLEEISFASFLLLNVEIYFIDPAMTDERLNEVFRVDGAHDLGWHLENLKHTTIKLVGEVVKDWSCVFHQLLGALKFIGCCAGRRLSSVFLRRLHPINLSVSY